MPTRNEDPMGSTFVPLHVRRLVVDDPDAGAGNALETALRISPDPHAPFLCAEVPPRAPGAADAPAWLSLAGLRDLVDAWSAWYAGRGVGPRDRVGVWFRDGAANLVHFLALSRLGAIAVLVNGGMDPQVATAHLGRTGPVGVQTDDEHLALVAAAASWPAGCWVSSIDAVDAPGPVPAGPPPVPFVHAAGDPVLICHTSGTTGVPKPVVWSHDQVMVGVRAHLTRFRDHPGSLVVSALPQSHGSAIGYALLAMLTGVPVVLMSDRGGRAVADVAGRHGATIVVGFASTLAEIALQESDHPGLAQVERWVSVGDASHGPHVERLVARGRHRVGDRHEPGSLFVDGFGSSELGWGGVLSMMTVPGVVPPHRCLGRPQPFADVAVLRPDGTVADADEVGLLGVRGPTVTPGYWDDSDRTYRSLLGGYWLSGDLVYRDGAGRFYHVDRAVDAVPTAAGTVYSVLTEEILLAHLPQVEDCVVVGSEVGDEVVAVALVRLRHGDVDGLLERANAALGSLGRPPLADVREVDAASVPVGVTGKVLKRHLRQASADVRRPVAAGAATGG